MGERHFQFDALNFTQDLNPTGGRRLTRRRFTSVHEGAAIPRAAGDELRAEFLFAA